LSDGPHTMPTSFMLETSSSGVPTSVSNEPETSDANGSRRFRLSYTYCSRCSMKRAPSVCTLVAMTFALAGVRVAVFVAVVLVASFAGAVERPVAAASVPGLVAGCVAVGVACASVVVVVAVVTVVVRTSVVAVDFAGTGRAASAVGCMAAVVEAPALTARNVHAGLVVANAMRWLGVRVGLPGAVVLLVRVVVATVVGATVRGELVDGVGVALVGLGTSIAFAPVAATGGVTVVRAMRSLNDGVVAVTAFGAGAVACGAVGVSRGTLAAIVGAAALGTAATVGAAGFATVARVGAVIAGRVALFAGIGLGVAVASSGFACTTVSGITGIDDPPERTPGMLRCATATVGLAGVGSVAVLTGVASFVAMVAGFTGVAGFVAMVAVTVGFVATVVTGFIVPTVAGFAVAGASAMVDGFVTTGCTRHWFETSMTGGLVLWRAAGLGFAAVVHG